jgi:hypothetical protein
VLSCLVDLLHHFCLSGNDDNLVSVSCSTKTKSSAKSTRAEDGNLFALNRLVNSTHQLSVYNPQERRKTKRRKKKNPKSRVRGATSRCGRFVMEATSSFSRTRLAQSYGYCDSASVDDALKKRVLDNAAGAWDSFYGHNVNHFFKGKRKGKLWLS